MSDDAGVRIRRSARHAKRLETAPSMAHALLSLVALSALFVDVVAAGAEHNKHATSFDQGSIFRTSGRNRVFVWLSANASDDADAPRSPLHEIAEWQNVARLPHPSLTQQVLDGLAALARGLGAPRRAAGRGAPAVDFG